MKLVLRHLAAPGLLALSFSLQARDARADLLVGVERLFGLTYASATQDGPGDAESNVATTYFSLGTVGADGVGASGSEQWIPHVPRAAADWRADYGLTLGGAIGLGFGSGSSTVDNGNMKTETDAPSTTQFVIAPRVGYWAELTPMLAIWPRGGLSYFNMSAEVEQDDGDKVDYSSSLTALTIEAPLVIQPVQNLAFTVSPAFDIGLSYDEDTPGPGEDPDVSVVAFGIQFGMLGIF